MRNQAPCPYSLAVKSPVDRGRDRRADQDLAAHPGRRLPEQGLGDVAHHLANLGRSLSPKRGQFRQAVHALQQVFVLAGVVWLESVR